LNSTTSKVVALNVLVSLDTPNLTRTNPHTCLSKFDYVTPADKPKGFLCLTASNKMTAVAIATFNDSVLARIGIEIVPSANLRAISLAPCASLHTIRAAGFCQSIAVYDTGESAVDNHTPNPSVNLAISAQSAA
jgi:hypothetical protein